MDKGIKGAGCMLNSCRSILLPDLALRLITAVCPVFLLNSISNRLSRVMDSLFCVDMCVYGDFCVSNRNWTTAHRAHESRLAAMQGQLLDRESA